MADPETWLPAVSAAGAGFLGSAAAFVQSLRRGAERDRRLDAAERQLAELTTGLGSRASQDTATDLRARHDRHDSILDATRERLIRIEASAEGLSREVQRLEAALADARREHGLLRDHVSGAIPALERFMRSIMDRAPRG